MISSVAFFEVILNNCNAKEVFSLITALFCEYDRLIDLHGCHKIGSIRDWYYVVSGIQENEKFHAAKILNLAIAMLFETKKILVPQINIPVVVSINFIVVI